MTTFLTQHGLPLLFAAVGIESVGVPVPGETALIAFAVLASQGHYAIATVIAVAAAAAVVGDNIGFWLIGRRGGRALVARSSRLERILPRAQALIDRYGGRAVFLGRFVAVLRETVAWVAGLAGMSWTRFLFWNACGGVVWATAVGLVAFYGGKAFVDAAGRYVVVGCVACAIAVVVVRKRHAIARVRSKTRHHAGATAGATGRRPCEP